MMAGSFLTYGSDKSNDPSPEEIIRRFAAKETAFLDVWEKYAYTQRILFQVLGRRGEPTEQRQIVLEVYFTSDGQRHTRKVSDRGAISSVGITDEDMSDATHLAPFVLTADELPKYDLRYRGKEQVDELDTYVFDVRPRQKVKGERYFEGRIWVDDIDFQIVMTRGKAVPDYRDNKFPRFETRREQIDGQYWFPTWTEADDILVFSGHSEPGIFGQRRNSFHRVHVRQLITYSDFKKFEVGTSIRFGEIADDDSAPSP
jgi:hypothetical protein